MVTIPLTTHGFVGNGAYELSGSDLAMIPDGQKKREVTRVRWEKVNELGQWSEALHLLQVGPDGKPYELLLYREP
jgi:hypothetical protein